MDGRHDRLRRARIDRGYKTATDAADAYGWNRNTYASNENGNAPFSFRKAKEYAKAYGVRPEWLYENSGPMKPAREPRIPIVGKVGANPDGTVLFAHGQLTGDTLPLPPDGSETAKGLEVAGYSMPHFADDGSAIYYDYERTEPAEEWVGHVVIVQLDTDEVLIKRLLRGSAPGLWDLESLFGPTRRDARLAWVALVTAVIPPLQARRIIRRAEAA
ncbi:MAG TPA: helix-turn-helix domain-containing protein [Phenylobacterium sp.]|nr:helix-turn-helix domain-containing protein [Phenylobacterium sp.]